jgi:nucleoside diphosphate kinase
LTLLPYSFKLVAIKLITASKEHLEKHYADLAEKPFFKGLVTCTYCRPQRKRWMIGSYRCDRVDV